MMSDEREDIVKNKEGKDQESSTSSEWSFKKMEVVSRDLASDAMKIYPEIDKDMT